MPNKHHTFFATCPKGIEALLYQEILSLDNPIIKQSRSGVFFKGPLQSAYNVCLWSRLANRVLLPLARFEAKTPDDLYHMIHEQIKWEEHMNPEEKIAVDFTADHRNTFHSHYATLRVKDAVADRFREKTGHRPSVDTENPDIRINVHMKKDLVQVSLDLSGESLHRRFYRTEGGVAPLKENLAAALLLRAHWPQLAQKGAPLVDPLCGSGTLLIEGAFMAMDRAPGLLRKSFGFSKWKQHDRVLWQRLLKEAEARFEKGIQAVSRRFFGFDRDPEIIAQAGSNAVRAGIGDIISFRVRDIKALTTPENASPGLLITNPPYGERMGKKMNLENLYETLGDRLKKHYQGWSASVFTASPDLAKKMGIRARKQYHLFNGPIPCKLLNFDVQEKWAMHDLKPGRPLPRNRETPDSGPGIEMFQNRLKKNLRILGKWALKKGITCYRLYDADMPEYAVAIDVYEDQLHVQEYRAPASVSPHKAKERLNRILSVLPEILQTPHDKIIFKVRERKKKDAQYERFDSRARFFEVRENDLRFLVNLTDYLDTGLFLDQRLLRERLQQEARGKRVLNLFCYTATATVYAAAGNAAATTSVDMSGTYLKWAEKNLALNRCEGSKHRLVQADCLEWIASCNDRYDLIYLDPPTFSNSKRMKTSFDVQRDHTHLLTQTLRLLSPHGVLMFSTNRRKFKLDSAVLNQWFVRDITHSTIPRDFQRNPHIHKAFEIKEKAGTS
ncbi:MAG: bifunctional 23S rRNA (guanine(2069)-N(7))-methyltransferase RlmK/23S rRNA (guanine(2445)-N(2))-methyltransferase RlmL [Deltaproteobacteria bacterium]|nr:bifunctional 23S rRNA (guanine(2069)-N(7))-methyltransferase RlmK/23S rRNA (guanine(2445)-N(2))-methyltransferase RlmL [Deltaproteobacteria bacterium]